MVVGETVILFPVPTKVPLHNPVNHSIAAPVPRFPPLTVNAVLSPLQIVVVPVILVGATEAELIIAVTSNLDELSQPDTVWEA